ncbi:hypothetical protein IAQ61_001542 [Plenodomus lingam]|uniref:uncharacterized protein n=1 Tax=Leptosphaeria maculans TaxID=5022 RepID=UPI00331671A8|nr:hypothetical protein IAQ61_001542 [Plenodomus lingam]
MESLQVLYSRAADMLYDGYARVVSAKNATQLEVNVQNVPGATEDAAAATSTIYQSTGIQTQPLCDVWQYLEIFGRNALVTEVGTGAIGRYTKGGGAFAYEHRYGKPFLAAPLSDSDTKSNYTDSAFQTIGFPNAIRSIAKAKVKASMMVTRYRKVAEEAGVRVFAESKAERVLHSEQFTPSVTLDAEGNTKDGELGSLFLPNIYGEDIKPVKRLEQVSANYHQTQRAIPSLAPSLREDTPDPEPLEDYGQEQIEWKRDAKHRNWNHNESGRSDFVPRAAFIVYDPARHPSYTTSSNKANSILSPGRRKRPVEDEQPSSQKANKRTKLTASTQHNQEHTPQPHPQVDCVLGASHIHQEEIRGRKQSDSLVSSHETPTVKPDRKLEAIPQEPRKERERTATILKHTPRGRAVSPRRAIGSQRARSSSPSTNETRSYRARENYRSEDSKRNEPVREYHPSSRNYRNDFEDCNAASHSKLQTPLPDKAQPIFQVHVDRTQESPNVKNNLGSEQSILASSDSEITNGQSNHNYQSTPTPAPRHQHDAAAVAADEHITHHRDGKHLAPPTPHQQPKAKPQEIMHQDRLCQLSHPLQTSTFAYHPSSKPSSHLNSTHFPTPSSPRHTQLHSTRTHAPAPSSRVEKSYRATVRQGIKGTTAMQKPDEGAKKTGERKAGPRPKRDARSLINRWLGG